MSLFLFWNNMLNFHYLYEKTHEEKYAKASDILREQLNRQPRTSDGGFWHKKMYPYQMWLDGLYMAEPFYAEYIKMFGKEKSYDDVVLQFSLIDKHSKDREILINMVRDLADALIKVRSKSNFLWYQVMDKENDYGNYPEASCSCMFTYFLLKAVRKGAKTDE